MLRLTIAFATAAHAADGLAFIDRAHLGVRQTAPTEGGEGGRCVQVELEVDIADVRRLETLLHGVHAIVLAEPVAAA
jgi:hypothetical protein